MTTHTAQQNVLLIGKSRLVLDDSVAGLRELGYAAEATNDFTDVTDRFEISKVDLVVFGGQVPPDRRAELIREISAINPTVIFVQGLAGIPGLIIHQVQGAFYAAGQAPNSDAAPMSAAEGRTVRLQLPGPADVTVTAWWGTSFVPPDPKSDSLVLLEDRLAGGEHFVRIPNSVPTKAAFATVKVDDAIHSFSVSTES
jgi:hypothetical protein